MARLAALYFAYFGHLGAYVAYFSLWLDARGHAPAAIAAVLAVPQFVRIVAPPLWGWIADTHGARFPGGLRGVVTAMSLLAALSFAQLHWVTDLAAVFACVALTALFTSGVLPLVEAATLSALGAQTERYGPVRLWGSVGFIASVLAVGTLLDRQPTAMVLPVITALMLLAAMTAMALPAQRSVPAPRQSAGLGRVLSQPRVQALFAACFCMSVAHGALYAFYSIYLVSTGHSKTLVGALWTLGVVAEIAIFLALPWLFRRYSLRALLIASFLAAGLRFAVIGWGIEWLLLVAAAQLLHAFTFGAYHGAAVAAVHRLFPGPLALRGQALYASLSYGLGGACGMLLAGWTWGRLGPQWTFTLSAAFGITGALLIACKVRVRGGRPA